jgi:hypothetical protein
VHPGAATRSQSAWAFLKVYMELGSYFLFLQEQIKDIIIIKADRHIRLLTIETESRLGTLWDQEGCNCSKEELWEAARDEEMKIPWQAANEGLPVPEEQYQERFWRQRLDGIRLDTASKEFLAIEFKRTRDARFGASLASDE